MPSAIKIRTVCFLSPSQKRLSDKHCRPIDLACGGFRRRSGERSPRDHHGSIADGERPRRASLAVSFRSEPDFRIIVEHQTGARRFASHPV